MALPPTTGAPLDLYVPAYDYGTNPGDDTYDVPLNLNWNILNSFAETIVLFNPTATQTIAQPGSTFLNFNAAIAYDGSLRFGTAASAWDSALSRSGAGTFTLDSNTIGNAQGTLTLLVLDATTVNATTVAAGVVNATTGFKFNGAAPSGHILVGNGTEYVDGRIYYQTTAVAGASNPQEPILNFIAGANITVTGVDNPGSTRTDLTIGATGLYSLGGTLSNTNIVVGAAAGIGASATIQGLDGNHLVVVTVANTGSPGHLFTVTFTAPRGHVSYCILQCTMAGVDIHSAGSTSGAYSAYTSDSLAPGSYALNVICP